MRADFAQALREMSRYNLACSESLRGFPTTFAVFAAVVLFCSSALAADSYCASGHLTYTGLDARGEPVYRKVLLFDLRVSPNGWHIRTEPILQGFGGIGFYEGIGGSNDTVLRRTTLAMAYRPPEVPIEDLRAQVQEIEKEAIEFMQKHPAGQDVPAFSRFAQAAPRGDSPRATGTNQLNNDAVASVFSGEYPPTDSSEIALLWFAFTPPKPRADRKMLLQVWDDGHPTKHRFRRATWKQFADPLALISEAEYHWPGVEIAPDGTIASIGVQGTAVAARYEVAASTNVGGFALPRQFRLTRYVSEKPGGASSSVPRTVSTTSATLARVLVDDRPAAALVPSDGATFVSDFRLSSPDVKGAVVSYVLRSNDLPSVQEVKQSRNYQRVALAARLAGTPLKTRILIVAFLVLSTLILGLVLWRRHVEVSAQSKTPTTAAKMKSMNPPRTANSPTAGRSHNPNTTWQCMAILLPMLLLTPNRSIGDTEAGCASPQSNPAAFCGDNGTGTGCMKTVLNPTPQDCSGPNAGLVCFIYQVTGTRTNYKDWGACLPARDCDCDNWSELGTYTEQIDQAYNNDTGCGFTP